MAKDSKLGRHAGVDKAAEPAYVQKSKRVRRVLIVVIIVLVLLAAGFIAAGYLVYDTASTKAEQQQNITSQADGNDAGEAKDDSGSAEKQTVVPDLVTLLGASYDDAVVKIAHGAQVSSNVEVNEEGNPIKREVRLALTEEPADSRSGTPTVTLSLNEENIVLKAGYQVATTSLGYGKISFRDAALNENIVEKTLEEAGLDVTPGLISLPEDQLQYSTYATDGKTLIKESYTFDGTGTAGGATYPYSATLTYDYSVAKATDNLDDTIRTISVAVSAAS
jgi:hypothetical protein